MDTQYRVLVIDDSTTYVKILKTYLERQGYEVLTADTGEAGLEMVVHDPHLILCDYGLPGMRGDEFCKRLRKTRNARDIPIIMLTPRGTPKTTAAGRAAADDYILKSEDLDVLLLRVKETLQGSASLPVGLRGAAAGLERQRVLAIDDDRFYLTHLCQILMEDGYEIHEATSGLEGLAAVEKQSFDLILVDFIMPGILGDEVCRRLKAQEKYRDIPVVLLSSRGDKTDMIAGLNAGADDYIVKASDTEILRSRVKALVRRKFFQDETRRIQEELRVSAIEAERARSERDLAQARARMADELSEKNRTLEDTNRKLKEAQTALIQAEKMAALGQLVAGIVHEINNPLAYVCNNLVTIQRDVEDICKYLSHSQQVAGRLTQDHPELANELVECGEELDLQTAKNELTSALEDTREGLERMKNIVLNLRNFSRLDEGDIKVVDVTEGIESTLKIIGHLVKERITIERDYAPAPKIECYPGLLNQVFMNLLVNACQSIDNRGVVRISTARGGDRLRIEISDSGCGIPTKNLNKIFEPFFTTKDVGSGTGLGLSTSYGIIQNHGGQIQVESTPGKGSTFTIWLPLTLPRPTTNHA